MIINSTDPRKLNPKQKWRKAEKNWEAIKFTLSYSQKALTGIRNL